MILARTPYVKLEIISTIITVMAIILHELNNLFKKVTLSELKNLLSCCFQLTLPLDLMVCAFSSKATHLTVAWSPLHSLQPQPVRTSRLCHQNKFSHCTRTLFPSTHFRNTSITDGLTRLSSFGYNIFNNSVHVVLSHFAAVSQHCLKVVFTLSKSVSCQLFTVWSRCWRQIKTEESIGWRDAVN